MSYHELRVDEVGNMGRCVFASRDIPKGICITKCELLVLPEFDSLLVNDTVLKHYTFKYNERQDCIVLGDGSIFNHSDTPNVEYVLQQWGERKVMIFIALRDIKADEQLFTNYSQDTSVNIEGYIKQASLTK